MKIQRNKITAVIGPSGCGKSTLLRAVNRMNELVPDNSSVYALRARWPFNRKLL